MNRLAVIAALFLSTSCGAAPVARPLPDGGEEFVPEDDAGHEAVDAGPRPDAGHPAVDAGHGTPDAGHPVDAGPPAPTCGYAPDPYTPGPTCPNGTCSAPFVLMAPFAQPGQCFDCRSGLCDACGSSGDACCLGTSCRVGLACTAQGGNHPAVCR